MNSSPKTPTKKLMFVGIPLTIITVLAAIAMGFYFKQAFPIVSILLELNLVRFELQRWLKEVKHEEEKGRYKRWYKQLHSVAALMWLSFAITFFIAFFPFTSDPLIQESPFALFFAGTSIFLLGYTLFLYLWRTIKSRKGQR